MSHDGQSSRDRARESARVRRDRERVNTPSVLRELCDRILDCGRHTDEEVRFMSHGQRFTSDPRLALAYYYCCGVDLGAFVFGGEQLNGGATEGTRRRLKRAFDDYPKSADIAVCQSIVRAAESESTNILACASCGRILPDNGDDVVVYSQLKSLHAMFLLGDSERSEVFSSAPTAIVKRYRQLYFDRDDVYYLIPELARDHSSVPLCGKCFADPRKSPFSVGSGHDYGRTGSLPDLTPVALGCIAPIRCFGMDISISGKHPTGHAICFPSDGPGKVATVLPRVDAECIPRVTFIGPEEEWRIQRKQFRALYSIPVDDV